MITTDEQREILDDVLEHMDECATLLRSLHNDRIDAYCLAAFEGKDGGWLGEFERDIIEQYRSALDNDGTTARTTTSTPLPSARLPASSGWLSLTVSPPSPR